MLRVLTSYDFNPRSPRGATTCGQPGCVVARYFNPRSPRRERLTCARYSSTCRVISIHAPRAGSDVARICLIQRRDCISIHAPRAGSDSGRVLRQMLQVFQSTLPAQGATLVWTGVDLDGTYISIHAPRAGSDRYCRSSAEQAAAVSIHAPARGATRTRSRTIDAVQHVSIHAPRGERRRRRPSDGCLPVVSIHAPARGATTSHRRIACR